MNASIASGHTRVTEAAVEILRAGGNAFDAAVGAVFTSAMAEPTLTSLGGGGFLLAKPADGPARVFDFFVDTPGRGLERRALENPHFEPVQLDFGGSMQAFNVGLGSVAVPGTVRGLLHAHGRLGRMPLREVIHPGWVAAREGVILNEPQAFFLTLLRPILTLTAEGRAEFEPQGRPLVEGERMTNAPMAAFLQSLPIDGDREFYEGELARRLAETMREGGGLVTREDLASYEVRERDPISLEYRGRRLITNPAPALGGPLLAHALRLLEAAAPAVPTWGSAAHLDLLTAVMRELDRQRAAGFLAHETPDHDTVRESVARIRVATQGTTHVSVCDGEGNLASLTTSNGAGSGCLMPGTGILLNNMMGEDDLHPEGYHASPPGERVASMMSPSIVMDEHGALVLGSGGSKRIRTALLQVISNVVDHGMALRDAVDAPRVHWDGEHLQVEPGYGREQLDVLATRHLLNCWPRTSVYFGGVHAVTTTAQAAADPRRGGVSWMQP